MQVELGIAKNRLRHARQNKKQMSVGTQWLNIGLLRDGFSRLDAFGEPVSLTFKGRSTY